MPDQRQTVAQIKRSILTVGGGRGFIVADAEGRRLVITAAHCLPYLPAGRGLTDSVVRTYSELIAPLGNDPEITVECLFVDPIGDVAVLGPPDREVFPDEDEAYQTLVGAVTTPLRMMDLPASDPQVAWLLSLQGEWFRCSVQRIGGLLGITEGADRIEPGMFGSPIIDDNGHALGVVSDGGTGANSLSPRLAYNLPAWLAPPRRRLIGR